ncbi:hypothetical protein QFZ75_002249 [Streptomyces sp. V3I8]|uniref:hypothetical protein n=1 Tax=Streptomyces sp. V3I8 TaxID=3042279 RepID=UPI00277FE235|nr:hypothetical protein [Streptomyces sp. V3I8]MDQ1035833.1 hypothetical protein [Streptomyces sp. V3I8]
MPFTLPSRTPSGPRRRSLLAGAAGAGAALLAGCSASDSSPGTTGSSSAAARARARAARDSERLAERYRAVLAAHPALDARLAPLLAEVVRHAQAFGGGGRASDAASASAPAPSSAGSSTGPPAGASPSPSPAVPATRKAALAELAAAERALTDRRMKALADVPGELARLLASVAAAGAGHAFLLTEDEK